MTGLDDLADLARQTWRGDAACAGATVEFVDPSPGDVPELLRTYCWRCVVVGHCREQADRDAPHKWPVVLGARFYAKGEPADGWEVAS